VKQLDDLAAGPDQLDRLLRFVQTRL